MRYYTMRRYDTNIHIVEFHEKNDDVVTQIIKSGSRKLPPSKMEHRWFKDNGYHAIAKINLGFYHGNNNHLGLLATDHGDISGVPNNGIEAIMRNGQLELKQLNNVGIAGLGQNWSWATSTSYSLIIEGKINISYTNGFSHHVNREPRTMIGQRSDGTFLFVVADGRSASSRGLTSNMQVSVMLELGCVNATNLDGGGSSCMVVNNKVVNKPSDGSERPVGTCLAVFSKTPTNLLNTPSPAQSPNKPTLRLGDRNEDVKFLQESFNRLGISVGAVDGIFGLNTENGVKTFQRSNGLISDGIVGRMTWETLLGKLDSNDSLPKDERKIKVAIDAGHGMLTPGKGVPQMREHEFNATVAQYAKELAEYNGFDVLLTQPLFSNIDVPLVDRTNLAIKEKVDLLVSIHADANDNSNTKGHWAFYWNPDNITTSSIKQLALDSQKFAQIWDKHANQIMKNHCRGLVKSTSGQWNNFHMCRVPVTNRIYGFPSILIEHAFMTSPDEIKLLLSDDFRRRCAETLVRALCEHFNITFKPMDTKPIEAPTTPPKQEEPQVDNLYRVLVDGNQVYALRDKENIARNIVNELNNGASEIKIQKV